MNPKLRIVGKTLLALTVPATPVLIWYKFALDDRTTHKKNVDTKIRIPNVQTIDDLLVEKCLPGDVILFDRRADRCAAGPLAALACLVNRLLLCDDDESVFRAVETGKYDHVGLVVPGTGKFDPVMLVECTAGRGIVSRPLRDRLEMTRSRSVTLLPLSGPGEMRNDENYDPPEKIRDARKRMGEDLCAFRDAYEKVSRERGFEYFFSCMSIVGAGTYALGLKSFSPSPVSPSAWLVVTGMQLAGVAENITGREGIEARVEDFLRDGRFQDEDVVKLRPGWKLNRPVTLRETNKS